ncbi:MAG TPA: hypothetical protein VJA66_10600 [Thermoanaerobaculia bacterium]
MKRSLFLAAVAPVISALALAEGLPKAEGPTPTLGELMSHRPATISTQGLITGSGYGFESQIVVPVVIRAPGKNGTFYITDYFLMNGRGASQEVLIGFMPSGVTGVNQPTSRYQLAANTTYSIPDFLGSGSGDLNISGVGSLLITAVLPGTGTLDTNGQLYGAARIWTQEPGSASASTSFTEWAVEPGVIHGPGEVAVIGARQNANFRANFGVVNFDVLNARTFAVTIITTTGQTASATATIPPLSMGQVAVPSSVDGGSNGYLLLHFTPPSSMNSAWYAFGTSADQLNGDAWYSVGIQLQ